MTFCVTNFCSKPNLFVRSRLCCKLPRALSEFQVRSLQVMYVDLISTGRMDRLRFRDVMCSIFDITEDVMLDRMFRVFDNNNDTIVSEKF